MEVTYHLAAGESGSTEFYEKTRQLAEQLEEEMAVLIPDCRRYQTYIDRYQVETVRGEMEYAMELLDFAVLHKWIQEGTGKAESLTDTAYAGLLHTCSWLKQSQEFAEELLRFIPWMRFLMEYGRDDWALLWKKIDRIVTWIEYNGEQKLAKFTANVDNYLKKQAWMWKTLTQKEEKKLRADYGLLLQGKTSYYLNMIGAQILNHCYRKLFQEAAVKYIFVPGCMAAKKQKCAAAVQKDDSICVECTKDCQIAQITKQQEDTGVKVRIVRHGSELDRRPVKTDEQAGVVGIACVLNLLSGGWKARRLGYAPQCVILNSCGCKQHWCEEAQVTAIAQTELQTILQE